MQLKNLWLVPLLLFSCFAYASEKFQEGKDYEVLSTETKITSPIQVIEFFSSACPGCKYFEPALVQWLKTKPKNVDFQRVPVLFHPGWDVFAKAHYTAKTLDVTSYPGLFEKIHADLFTAIQANHRDLTNEAAMAQFFIEHGVSLEDFNNTYNFSPGIDAQIAVGQNKVLAYKIYQIPSLVIAGKYKVSALQAASNERFIEILNYLIKKAAGK